MSLQTFWRPDGLKSFVTFITRHCRTFSTSTVRALSPDPIKRRIQLDRLNERARLKRQTDPEWAKKYRDKNRIHLSNWKEKNGPRPVEYARTRWAEHYAHDPTIKLRKLVHRSTRNIDWLQSLPWKSHVPILYKEKVPHTCSKCGYTRHGGYKLWWKQRQSVDDTQSGGSQQEQGPEKYLCSKCYMTGPEAMPAGYEDVTSLKELSARSKELGHGR